MNNVTIKLTSSQSKDDLQKVLEDIFWDSKYSYEFDTNEWSFEDDVDIEDVFNNVIQDFSWIHDLPLDDDQKHDVVSEIARYVAYSKLT